MEKKNTITIRLSDEQYGWLRALSRRSKRSQSEVVHSGRFTGSGQTLSYVSEVMHKYEQYCKITSLS